MFILIEKHNGIGLGAILSLASIISGKGRTVDFRRTWEALYFSNVFKETVRRGPHVSDVSRGPRQLVLNHFSVRKYPLKFVLIC